METKELQQLIINRKRSSGAKHVEDEAFGKIVVGLALSKSYKDIAANAKVSSNTALKICKAIKAGDKATITRITTLKIDENAAALGKKFYPETTNS